MGFPVLFNLFKDELSQRLKACKTGCFIGFTLINLLLYADDLVVFRPSSAGLQELCKKVPLEQEEQEESLLFLSLFFSLTVNCFCD